MYLSDALYPQAQQFPGSRIASTLVDAPAGEPLSLVEIKPHLRVDMDLTAEDTLIAAYMKAARNLIEEEHGIAMLAQTWDVSFMGRCTYVSLPKRPVNSIVSAAMEARGTTSDVPLSSLRLTKGKNPSVSRYDNSRLITGDVLTIQVECGYASPAAVPELFKQAIRMAVSDWYENRGTFVVGTVVAKLPGRVSEMLAAAGYGRVGF